MKKSSTSQGNAPQGRETWHRKTQTNVPWQSFPGCGRENIPSQNFATLLYLFSINFLIHKVGIFRVNWMIPPFKISRWKSTAPDCREMLPLIWKPTSDKMGQPKFGGETTKQKPFGEWCWSYCNHLRHVFYLRPLSFVNRCNYIYRIKCHTEASFLFMSVVLLPGMFCILYWCPTNTSTKKKSPKQSHRCRCASCPWRYTR